MKPNDFADRFACMAVDIIAIEIFVDLAARHQPRTIVTE
jgi:hypothetical protein